jgi:hypothetical protein
MSFLDAVILGAHVWLWLVFFFVLFCVACAVAYWNREKIKERWLKLRWPERCIEICIHYPGNPRYKSFWRLTPPSKRFDLSGGIYRYDKDKLIKNTVDLIADNQNGQLYANVAGLERHLNLDFLNRKKGEYPQLHYIFNQAEPLDFANYSEAGGFALSAGQLHQIVKSDLWNKALDLSGQNSMILIGILIGVFNLFLSCFILAKIMGWIK